MASAVFCSSRTDLVTAASFPRGRRGIDSLTLCIQDVAGKYTMLRAYGQAEG
jgi:hypothetical protein